MGKSKAAKAESIQRPVIKWTGGKAAEIPALRPFLPKKIDTFIDPFVGGGALLYNIKAERYCINDIDRDLMTFYIMTWKTPLWTQFKQMVQTIDEARTVIRSASFRKTIPSSQEFIQVGMAALHTLNPSLFCPIANGSLLGEYEKRMAFIEQHKDSMDRAQDYLRTGLFSVLYNSIRSAMNTEVLAGRYNTKRLVAWFFLRDMAYSSMQRTSKNGAFNVPYGGASYNNRLFSTKLDKFANYRKGMTTKTFDVHCRDFVEFLHYARDKYGDDRRNFIFLDPPYDTAFSSYSSRQRFMPERYQELLSFLLTTKMRFMMVLKETPLMRDLFYNQKGWYYRYIEKTYRVNIKNRNNRSARHVIITNYKKPVSAGESAMMQGAPSETCAL